MFNEENWGIQLGEKICNYTRVFDRFLTTKGEIKDKVINSSFKQKEEIERWIDNKNVFKIYDFLKSVGVMPREVEQDLIEESDRKNSYGIGSSQKIEPTNIQF